MNKKYRKVEYVQRRVGLGNVQDVLGKASEKGHLLSKDVFRQRLSSVKDRLPSKIVFRQRLSSVKGGLLSKVVFRQRSSSVNVCLQY